VYTKQVAQCPACGLVQPSGVCCMDCGRMLETPAKSTRSVNAGAGLDPLASIEDELRRMTPFGGPVPAVPVPRKVGGTAIEIRTGDVLAWEGGAETDPQSGDDFMDPTSLDLGPDGTPLQGEFLDETEQERPNPLPPEDIAALARSLVSEDDTAEVKARGPSPVPSISVSTESIRRPEPEPPVDTTERALPLPPRPRPPSARSEARRRPQFWDSFAGAFAVPFLGSGSAWLLLLFACAFASQAVALRFALGFYALFGAILAVYYARSITGGLAGEDRAPGFRAPQALIAEILAPAAALIALTLFLSAPLGWLSPEVVTVGVEEVSSAFDGRASPPAAPDAAAPNAAAPRLREILRARQLPRDRTLGILLLLCFAAYYGPMAFALAAVNRRTLQVANPVRVASRALRGGIAYFTIASVGVAVLFVFAVAALWLPPRGALALVLGALAYVCGVQGQLLGRLFAALPSQFLDSPDLEHTIER